VTTTTATTPRIPTAAPARDTNWPVFLCWLAVALEGFDLVVMGAVIPELAKTKALGFGAGSLTMVVTIGLVGVGIGAILIGPITDRFGRRRSLITCIAVFSVLTLLIAVAPNIATFAVLRFLAGLGLGACLPIALAFMSEYAPSNRGGTAVTRTMTGYHFGAVITALLALTLIPVFGWESMFVVGGVVGLLTLPLMWARLPESKAYLDVQADPERTVVRSSAVFKGRYLWVSIGLWVASFMGLLLVYGLNTWLPTIMQGAGYTLGASLALLLALNLGAITGLLIAGRISDARGNKPTVLIWFGTAAVFLAGLSIKIEVPAVLYAAVFMTGVFVFSAQVLVYAFVGHLYPTEVRGTAFGMASGVGRLGAIVGPFLGGALVTAGLAYPWGFYAFAIAALLAVAALALVPAHMRESGRGSREPERVSSLSGP
jgi:MFS transporter, AAHS family, benzoate transport protein